MKAFRFLSSFVLVFSPWTVLAEDYIHKDGVMAGLASQASQIAEACEVDMEYFRQFGADIMSSFSTGLVNGAVLRHDIATLHMQQLLAPHCTGEEIQVFEKALLDFKSCSSIDLRTLLESFADALIGTLIQCSPAIEFITGQVDDPDFAIPEDCIESFLGQNPLGDLLRSSLLFPDKVLPCFSCLSTNIPECTLDEWPIPLMGKLIKKISCLLGNSVRLIDSLSVSQVLVLSSCLQDSNTCQANLEACSEGSVTSSLPKPLLGAPLSDSMVRVAQQRGMQDVVDKYNTFLERCVADRWGGWTYEVGHSKGISTNQPITAPEILYMREEPLEYAAENGSFSSFGNFLGGLIVGLLLVSGIWVSTLDSDKSKSEPYQGIDRVHSEFALTECRGMDSMSFDIIVLPNS